MLWAFEPSLPRAFEGGATLVSTAAAATMPAASRASPPASRRTQIAPQAFVSSSRSAGRVTSRFTAASASALHNSAILTSIALP